MFANNNSNSTGPSHLAQTSTAEGWLLVILILVLVGVLKARGGAGEVVAPTTWESNTTINDTIIEQRSFEHKFIVEEQIYGRN